MILKINKVNTVFYGEKNSIPKLSSTRLISIDICRREGMKLSIGLPFEVLYGTAKFKNHTLG
jgi:hypothetical protein